MMRSPVSLARLRFTPGSPEVVYARKRGHDQFEQTEDERIDAMEFVARVLVQIPVPKAPSGPLALIKRILDHLRRRQKVSRPCPHVPQPLVSPA